MTYVGACVVIINVYSDAGVCAEVDDVPLWVVWIGIILLLGKEEDGIVVVALEGGAIHGKLFVPCLIDDLVNEDVVCDAWLGDRHWRVRHSFVERVLDLDQ